MRGVNRHSGLFVVIGVLVLIVITGLSTHSYGDSAGIEPKADQILRKMSDYLANLKQFRVQTENTLEVVLISGQKVQFDNPVNVTIKRPNKLHADRKGDVYDQEFYYDGKTLTLYSKGINSYATVQAPPTLDETLDFATDALHIEAPGGDLIYSNAYNILTEDVISGFYVGVG